MARTAAKTMKVGEGKRLYVAELNWRPIEEEPKVEGNVVAFRKRAGWHRRR